MFACHPSKVAGPPSRPAAEQPEPPRRSSAEEGVKPSWSDISAHAAALGFGEAIVGSTDQIIDSLTGFADAGVTRVEIVPYPNTRETLERLAPVMAALT